MSTGSPNRTYKSPDQPRLKVSTGYLVQSLLQVPVHAHGQVIGVLSVDNQISRKEFTEADENVLISLADYAAVAIENAHLFEQVQLELSERKRTEQALRESERRYELAARGANDGIWDWDLTANQIYYSSRWKAMLGFEDDEISTSPSEWFDRVHSDDLESLRLAISSHTSGVTSHFEKDFRMLHKDGSYLWMLARGIAVQEQEAYANRMAGSLTDIGLRTTADVKLLHDAFHDALTDLPNRALFVDRLSLVVEHSKRREDYTFAVLFLDLDRFKDINDSLGHTVGDQVIVAVARLLAKGLRSMDTVARLGGDEFVILLDDIKEANAAVRVANWIQKSLTSPLRISDHEILITASIGIVLSTIGYNQPEHVLRDADIAMYYAKSKGKARYEIFDPPMRERVIERLTLETELRQGIDRKELEVYYSRSLLDEVQITGFEACCAGGTLPWLALPDKFYRSGRERLDHPHRSLGHQRLPATAMAKQIPQNP
jgi:diguanylate cyclase (GGDEF)-like protein/PAS domain S-box-containing protein